jgi:hypothetical protein
MSFRAVIASGVLALSVAAGVGVAAGHVVSSKPAAGYVFHSTNTCQEDEACWDWRTMGDHQRGPCPADLTPGLVLPVGWTLECRQWPQERGVTTLRYQGAPVGGLTIYAQKKVLVDSGSWGNNTELQGAAAHEVCHAIRNAQGRTSPDYITEERAADACARAAGFTVPNHGV